MNDRYIPGELKELPQWVCYRLPSKMPLCAFADERGELRPASCKNQATWSGFETAVAAVTKYGASGVGIQFANGICGIDIDGCIDGGEPSRLARDIIAKVHSYTEISPSGTGIHILCKGRLPSRDGNRDSVLGLEMYDTGRYFTVTGNAYLDEKGMPYPLRDCTRELDEVHQKYLTKAPVEQLELGKAPSPVTPPAPTATPATASALPSFRQQAVRDLSDQEILDIAFRSEKGGDLTRRLYEGTYSPGEVPQHEDGTPDLSAVDLLFAGQLAFWFNCDAARIDRVFRASALYRPKWDKKRGVHTYGERTIERAIRDKPRTFIPYDRSTERELPPLPEPSPAPPPKRAATLPPVPPAPPDSGQVDIPLDPAKYTLDDTGNAYRYRDAYHKDVKYDHINGLWLCWTGKRWAIDQTGEVKRLANQLLEDMDAQAQFNRDMPLIKHIGKTRASKYKEAMLKEVMPMNGIPILPNELDRYKMLLNLRNGIINLENGTLSPHNRKLKLSMLADVEFDPKAECPLWMKFLDDVTCGDTEVLLYLQRMVGYCLTGSTREQCIFFLYGSGRNGKSTFLSMISSIMGDYTKNCQPETVMIKDRGGSAGARSDVARLKGARLVTTSEPSDGCRLDEGMVKQMTGEDIITARMLYHAEFDFRPEFKIVVGTNVKPNIKGSDEGIWRRVRLIPFTAQIALDKVDKDLGVKLQQERSGVFLWALHGAIDWHRHGLPDCPRIDNANQEYRKEMDKMQQFVGDCLADLPGHTLPGSQIYAVYKAWCEERGERYPMSNSKLSTELQDNYHLVKRKTSRFNEYLDTDFTDIGLQYLRITPPSPL